jgi:hypothetical protein
MRIFIDDNQNYFKSSSSLKQENQKPPIEWHYFYTPEYEVWHRHLQTRLEPTFKTVPIKIDKIDIHNQHPYHHFTGSVDRIKIVIDIIKKNLGKKIVFSDVTWVVNKHGVNELNEIIDNCKETTYAQNSSQTESINMGLICIYCSLDELELWSYCLGQLECDPNLHEQDVLNRRLKHKPMFDAQKIKADSISNAEQFEGYLALKIFTSSDADHITRYNHRIDTIKRFNLDF